MAAPRETHVNADDDNNASSIWNRAEYNNDDRNDPPVDQSWYEKEQEDDAKAAYQTDEGNHGNNLFGWW